MAGTLGVGCGALTADEEERTAGGRTLGNARRSQRGSLNITRGGLEARTDAMDAIAGRGSEMRKCAMTREPILVTTVATDMDRATVLTTTTKTWVTG